MDVWGPSPVASFSGFRYYLLLVDDFTKYCWLFPLHAKSEVTSHVQAFKVFVANQFSLSIKAFRSDNGGEFLSKLMSIFFAAFGILHETTCPHTPEQNGVAERKHGHIVETAIALLQQAQLPIQFWLEAVTTAIFLINRLPNSSVNFQVPFHLLYHKSPDYHSLIPFGCCCFPWLRPYVANKLVPRSTPCVFLGYCATTKGYRCLDPVTQRVYISRHVKFLENDFPYPKLVSSVFSKNSSSSPTTSIPIFKSSISLVSPVFFPPHSIPSPSHSSLPTPSIVPSSSPVSTSGLLPSPSPISSFVPPASLGPSSSSPPVMPSISTSSISVHPMVTRSKRGIVVPKQPFTLMVHASPVTEPSSFKEAMHFPEWQQAMSEEYSALVQQGTWSLVPLPAKAPVIGCKWIFRIKRNSDGSIARYKARLVAQGFQQTEGIDYTETFSPVVKQQTVRMVLSLAVSNGWAVKQLDVSNAFLHGTIQENVYLRQPPGYVNSQVPHHVCKLHKALYGLKQAPRAWYDMLSKSLIKQGFINSLADSSLFVFAKASDLVYVLVYVDDILIIGNNTSLVTQIIKGLGSDFALKDLGSLHYFLGIEVIQNSAGVILSQSKYATDLLLKAGMQGCTPCASPSSLKSQPSPTSDSPFPNPEFYRTIVGSLQYLTLTRPELSYAVNSVCQHMHQPRESHFTAVKRILRYVQGSINQGLQFTKDSATLTAFSDADWAGDSVDRRSTGGFCIFLGSNLISWSAKKQHTVARSSTEAEYKSLANTTAELIWLVHILKDLHFPVTESQLPVLWCDNVSAISLASNPVFHARTKHVEVDFHFVREKVLHKQLSVQFVPSAFQLVDIFTKPLTISRFNFLKSKLHLVPVPASVCGGMLSEGQEGHSTLSNCN